MDQSFRLRAAAFLVTLSLVATPLFAQTAIGWNYAGTDFMTGTNWTGGTVPANSITTNTASFGSAGASGTYTATLDANRSIAGLIAAAAGNSIVQLGGTGTLTLGASGINNQRTNNGAADQFTITSALALGANSTFTSAGGAIFSSGALSLGSFSLTLGGAGTGGSSLDGVISGTGGITKSGAGSWTLNGANTYSGVTTVSAGTLTVTNSLGLGSAAAGTTVASGASLELGGGITVSGEALTLNGTGVGSGGALRTSGDATVNSAITLGSATEIQGDWGLLTLAGNISGNAMALTFDGGSNILVSGIIGTTTGTLTKTGYGTLILSGANTYTGATTIKGGYLYTGANNVIADTSAITINDILGSTAIFDLDGHDETVASLTFGGTGATATSFNYVNSGAGTLTLAASGAVTVLATNNPMGASLSGNLNLGSTTHVFNIADSTGSDLDLAVDAVISGTGAITKSGAGRLDLAGASTYSGTTTVSAGTLSIQNALALGSIAAGTTVASGAALELGGSITVEGEALTLNGTGIASNGALRTATGSGNNAYNGTITLGSATQIQSDAGSSLSLGGHIGGNTFALTFDGDGEIVVSGIIGTTTGTLTKSGLGTLYLSGANTYMGTSTLTGGALVVTGSGTLGAGNLTLNGGVFAQAGTFSRALGTGAGQVKFGASGGGFAAIGGPLSITAFTGTPVWGTTTNFLPTGGILQLGSMAANGDVVTWTNNFSLGTAVRTIQLIDNVNTTADRSVISGIISGTGGLTITGNGLLELTGANTFSGTSTLVGGTLAITGSGTLGTGNLTFNGGVLAQSGTFSRALGTGAGQVQFSSGGGGFAAYGGALSITGFTGTPVWGSTAGFISGTLSLSSDQANQVVTWTNDFSLGSASRTINVTDNVFDTADYAVISGVISGTGSLTKSGTGLLVLNGTNTFSGGVTVSAGQIRATHAAALGTGTLVMNVPDVSLALAGDSGLNFGNNAALSLYSHTITSDRLTAGAGVNHTLGDLSLSNNLVVVKGDNVTSGTAGLTFGAVTLTSTGQFSPGSGTQLSLASITGAGRTISFSSTGHTFVTGAIDTTTGTLSKNGTGTLTLNGPSNRTGVNSFTAGTIVLGHDTALGSGQLTINGTTTLLGANGARTLGNAIRFTSGTTFAGASDLMLTGALSTSANNTLTFTNTGITTFSGSLALSVNSVSHTLTLNNSGALVISGVISNGSTSTAGALIKNGSGLLTLMGANTYAGNTTINAGTLNLSGSIPNSALTTIASGATLTGAGTLGDLTLSGTYAPGNSPALVSLGDFTMNPGSLLQIEIGGLVRGSGYDALDINGVFNPAGTLDVAFIDGFTPSAAATFNLFDFTSATGTFSTLNLPGLAGDLSWDSSALYTAGELRITGSAIPEPSVYPALAGLGALGLACWHRRRNAAAAT